MPPSLLDQLTISAEKSTRTKAGLLVTGSRVVVNLPTTPVRYLYSGWQSWSLTAWVNVDRPVRPMRPSCMHPMQTDPVYARETRPNGSWYGAVELPDGQIVFIGALGLESHVLLDGNSLTGWYEGQEVHNNPESSAAIPVGGVSPASSKEWFIATGEEDEIYAHYIEILGKQLGKGRERPTARVWCSWYSLYTDIHQEQLLKILSDLGPFDSPQGLPFDVFQVDDGWQVNVGDWEPNEKFSSGMDRLAAQIKSSGRKAGLWLAPLLVVPSSSVYRNHRDWLLHDNHGALVSAGFNWCQQLYALDTTHPAALDWLSNLMKRIRSWGYEYAKLDFLYAGALPGKRTVNMPREAAFRNGLKVLRDALGEATLLTCGTPILPSIGLCDGIRIGPDVAEYWTSHRDDDLLMNSAAPGVRNALRATLNHLWLQPLVQTDPDVAYFRSRQITLTREEKSLLQDMAQICNFKASSDIPAWLTTSERSALRTFLENHPRVSKTGRTTFQVGQHSVDFGSSLDLPPLPGFFTNLQGAILGWLANRPALMKLFNKMGKRLLRRRLRKNPV